MESVHLLIQSYLFVSDNLHTSVLLHLKTVRVLLLIIFLFIYFFNSSHLTLTAHSVNVSVSDSYLGLLQQGEKNRCFWTVIHLVYFGCLVRVR